MTLSTHSRALNSRKRQQAEAHLVFTRQRVSIGLRTLLLGAGLNIILAIIKFAAGYYGHAHALIADAAESAGDVLMALITAIGLYTAMQRPDILHPYGHGKAEPLAAIIIGIVIIAGAVWLGVSSVEMIRTPHQSPEIYTLWILIGVIVIKQTLFFYARDKANQIHSTSVKADAWHHLSDAVTSFAALIGIGISIIMGPGYESADDYAAILAALFIAYNAWQITLGALRELMDADVAIDFKDELALAIETVEGVESQHELRMRKHGLGFWVDVHVRVSGNLTVIQGHDIAHEVKTVIQHRWPQIADVLVHVEPA